MIDFKELIQAGVHFGHQKTRWNPKMAPYIWGFKSNVHLIDVSKTAFFLERAAKFLEQVAAEGKGILFVGTKKAARDIVHATAVKLGMPYVNHRWIGGTLSNFSQVKKSVTKCLHYEDILAKSENFPHYTKKELNVFKKVVERLKINIGGITNLKWPIGAVVVVDVNKEQSAVKEALTMGIPVVGLVDTNSDPTPIKYVIPSNDDAPRAIKLLINYLAEAIERGQETAKKQAEQQRKEKEAAKAAKKEAAAKEKDAEPKDKKAAKAVAKKAAKSDDSTVKAKPAASAAKAKKESEADDKEKKTTKKAAAPSADKEKK